MDARLRRIAVAVAVAAVALSLGSLRGVGVAPADDIGDGVPADAQLATVTRVVDGDTVRVVAAGPGPLPQGAHRIRLLEIDSPERDGDRPAECGAETAAAYVRRRLPTGTDVWLEADRRDVDRFGRPLRYVWTADGELLNRTIVARGHARAVLLEPNDLHWPVIRAAEDAARAERAGFWRTCADR